MAKYAVSCKKRLGGTAFLGWAAEVDDGAGTFFLFQIFFDGNGGRQTSRTEKIVSASMAVSALF